MVVLTLLSRHTFLDGVLLTCSVRSGEESGEAGRFFPLIEGVVNSVLRSDLVGDECACGDPGGEERGMFPFAWCKGGCRCGTGVKLIYLHMQIYRYTPRPQFSDCLYKVG